jgi:hypothetical protein
LDKDLSVHRREGDDRRMYECWFWKRGEGRCVLERSEVGGEGITDRGIEDVDEDT